MVEPLQNPVNTHLDLTTPPKKSNFDWKSAALACATTIAISTVAILIYQSYNPALPSTDSEIKSTIVDLNKQIKHLQDATRNHGSQTNPISTEPGTLRIFIVCLGALGLIVYQLTQSGYLPQRQI